MGKATVFWDVKPGSLVDVYRYQHFWDIVNAMFSKYKNFTLKKKAAYSSEMMVNFYHTSQC
jgi:hypothetical protein